jgi:hypothetical protein
METPALNYKTVVFILVILMLAGNIFEVNVQEVLTGPELLGEMYFDYVKYEAQFDSRVSVERLFSVHNGREYDIKINYQILNDHADAYSPKIRVYLLLYDCSELILETPIGTYIAGRPTIVPIADVANHTFIENIIGVFWSGYGGAYERTIITQIDEELVIYRVEANAFTEPPPREVARIDLRKL